MAASFQTLAPEIRFKIYESILLDSNVITWTREHFKMGNLTILGERLRPAFETGLFTANKSISNESLQYFYTQNAFRLIPSILVNGRREFRNCALEITYSQSSVKARSQVKDHVIYLEELPTYYAILAAERLPSLVRLINTSQAHRTNSFTSKLELFFQSNTEYFKGNDRTMAFLLEKSRQFRQISQWRCGGEVTELVVDGDITSEHAVEIINVTRNKMNLQHIWEEIDAAIAEADALFQSGDHLAAHGGYLLAFDLCHFPWPDLSQRKTREVIQAQCNIFAKLSLIDLMLGVHDHCAWRQAKKIFSPFDKMCATGGYPGSESDRAAMRICLGSMLVVHGGYKQVIREFEKACTICPMDESIKKRLEDFKARHQQPQSVLEDYILESDRSRQSYSAAFQNRQAHSRNIST